MEDLKKTLSEESTLLIDVRSRGEYSDGTVPKAINIPHNEISLEKLPSNKNQKMVVFCASGMRSAVAHSIIKGFGYKNVLNGGTFTTLLRIIEIKSVSKSIKN